MSDKTTKPFPTHLPPTPPADSLEKLKTKSAWWNFKASENTKKDTGEFRKLHVNIAKATTAPAKETKGETSRISDKPAQNPFAERIAGKHITKSSNTTPKSEVPVSQSLKNLKASQERLNGAISQISMRLHDGSARDEKVLSRINSLTNVVRQNIQTTSRIAQSTEETLKTTNEHLVESATKLENAFSQLEENQKAQFAIIQGMQSRTNVIRIVQILAFATVATLLALRVI